MPKKPNKYAASQYAILKYDAHSVIDIMPCCHPLDTMRETPAETMEQAVMCVNAWNAADTWGCKYRLRIALKEGGRIHQPIKVQTEFDLLSAIDWRELERHQRLRRNKI